MTRMIPIAFIVSALPAALPGQETMTVARFQEIVSAPVDNIPPNPKLTATGPLWTNATITVTLEFSNGKSFKDEATETSRAVQGKYVVTTVRSRLAKQPMDSIMTFDETASSYRVWALQGTNLIEGRIVYDLKKKIYALNSVYGNGVVELGVGSFGGAESSSRTLICTNGVLFCTRHAVTRPNTK